MNVTSATFALAMAGFVLLGTCTVLANRNRPMKKLLIVTTLIIVAHVAMVWTIRYEGSLAVATRNGHAGFVIFHAALLAILSANWTRGGRQRVMLTLSFLIVCIGASGAVFRYEEVAIYRIPVILTALVGAAAIHYTSKTQRLSARFSYGEKQKRNQGKV